MDWRAKVELLEEIRREYEFGVGTILGVAQKLGVHRRMVREALGNAVPSRRKKPERKRPRLAPRIPFIDAIWESDRTAPRKQRHTAHRIYQRLRAELPGTDVAESTVRRYVREKKQTLGLRRREVWVPQSDDWGSEGQVDGYEAEADLGGERQKLQVFSMRDRDAKDAGRPIARVLVGVARLRGAILPGYQPAPAYVRRTKRQSGKCGDLH